MAKLFVIFSMVPLFAMLMPAQEKRTSSPSVPALFYAMPVDNVRKINPVPSSPESLARGKKQYGYDCAMCHGKDGSGKGDVAADLKLKMNDETNPDLLKDHSDGELFYTIKQGKDRMPPEGDRVKDETIWDMVNYIRSFAKKSAASEKPAEEKAPN